jgi:soluble lytic murein transglycosylase-like protein
MKSSICALLACLATSIPAHAQVIEIDASGEARTFDGPAMFTEAEVTSLLPEEPVQAALGTSSGPVGSMLADAARAYGLQPGLLEAVAWQESRGRMNAVSPKGALGVMQLMPGTAAELGVQPTDLADNIRGGAIYLRRQIDRFGSVPLALAAYNAGPGAVMRYRGIPPYRETQDYVAKIMSRWRVPAALQPTPSISLEVPSQ